MQIVIIFRKIIMEQQNKNKTHKDFISLFNKRERIALLGKNYINLWTLVLIMFVTFIAIGFANGSLAYLSKKMSDPYVNWVNINLEQAKSEHSNSIIDNCNTDSIRAKYDIINVNGYNIFWLNFSDFKNKKFVQTEIGRTIELQDTLLSKIINESNRGVGFKSENDFGLIVTNELLEKYHYPKDAKFILHNYDYNGILLDTVRNIPIPILAVVESLPGNAMFISLPIFYYNRMKTTSHVNPFIVDSENSLLLFVDGNRQKANLLSSEIKEIFKNSDYYSSYDPYNIISKNMRFDDCFTIKIVFDPMPDNIYFVDSVYNYLLSNNLFGNKSGVIRLFDIESRFATNMSADHHYIAINFKELGKIRSFADYLASTNGIQIDIAQIKAFSYFDRI